MAWVIMLAMASMIGAGLYAAFRWAFPYEGRPMAFGTALAASLVFCALTAHNLLFVDNSPCGKHELGCE